MTNYVIEALGLDPATMSQFQSDACVVIAAVILILALFSLLKVVKWLFSI